MTVHGHTVKFDPSGHNIKIGLHYLEDHLSSEEAEPFFTQAKNHSSAQFSTSDDYKFTLVHHDSGYYEITARDY